MTDIQRAIITLTKAYFGEEAAATSELYIWGGKTEDAMALLCHSYTLLNPPEEVQGTKKN